MAKARVPVIAGQKVVVPVIAVSMETVARKMIVARKAVAPKATADLMVIVVPMLVAPRVNVVIPPALIDLVVTAKNAVRNVIVNSRAMVKSRATENDTLTRSSSCSQQAPSEIVRTGPSHFVIDASMLIAI